MRKLAGNNFANSVGNQIAIENKVKTEMQRLGISPLYTNYYILFAKNIAKKRGQERDVEFMKWYQRGMRHDWLRWIGKLAGEGRLKATREPSMQDQENLTGFWSIEEPSGATLEDVSGTGNDMTLVASPARTEAVVGNGIQLNGTSQYAYVNQNATINDVHEVTYMAWVKHEDQAIVSKIFDKETKRLNVKLDNRLDAIFSAATTDAKSTATGLVTIGRWTHAALTYSDTGDRLIHLYQDGVECAYSVHTAAVGALTSDATYRLALGAWMGGSANFFKGVIDEVRIWPRALSAAEIRLIYEAERPF